MAFAASKNARCPVCVGCTPAKLEEVNRDLVPMLEIVKSEGEVPKPRDQRYTPIANRLGVSPWSLHYHLRNCLIDLEIQDQRIRELKDLAAAIATAKTEYAANPSMQNAQAYTGLVNTFMAMATAIEGQQDPEVAVEFVVETVLGPLARKILGSVTEELRTMRDQVSGLVPRNHAAQIDSQTKASLARVSSALSDMMDEGLKNLCGFYKVEFEAKARKRALGHASAELGAESKSSEDDPIH